MLPASYEGLLFSGFLLPRPFYEPFVQAVPEDHLLLRGLEDIRLPIMPADDGSVTPSKRRGCQDQVESPSGHTRSHLYLLGSR